jgi:hypothetical protein
VQSQQLPTESQVLEDEVFAGTENADQPTEEMSERHDHGKNCSGKIRIELCAKSFILQVYDVLARHRCESATLRTHWVLVVMDQYTRRIIGFGVHAGKVDGVALCRMFNCAIRGQLPGPTLPSLTSGCPIRFRISISNSVAGENTGDGNTG